MKLQLVLVGMLVLSASGYVPVAFGIDVGTSTKLSPALLDRLNTQPSADHDVFFTYAADVAPIHLVAMETAGLTPLRVFDQWDVVYASGDADGILAAAKLPGVVRVTPN